MKGARLRVRGGVGGIFPQAANLGPIKEGQMEKKFLDILSRLC
jgi:hypothetical protein